MASRPQGWTTAQLEVLIEMAEDGASPQSIADVLGFLPTKVSNKLTVLEIVVRSPNIKLPPPKWKPNLDDLTLYP